jgi:putative hemolysin
MPLSGLLAGQGPSFPFRQDPDLFPFRGFLQQFLPMMRVRELYQRAQQPVNRSLMENVLAEMRVICQVNDADLARIPASGPVVISSNHPFGLLDGAVLGAITARVRPDVKILTNFLLSGIPELREVCIFVDPFRDGQSQSMNRRGLKQAMTWLAEGGALIVFPAGEVSHLQWPQMEIADPEWNPAVAGLARRAGAVTLPVFFPGRNSAAFQALGLVHPRLRTAWLVNEFLQQAGRKVEVHIGSPVSAETLGQLSSDREATRYLRWRTYLLAGRSEPMGFRSMKWTAVFPARRQEPVVPAVVTSSLRVEVSALLPIAENRDFSVYIAEGQKVPLLLQELGRLREITFRAAGEGTGRESDLDRFDPYYKHLLLWSKAKQELAGAYRMGATADILPQFGTGGLYTSTLFRYDQRLFDQLGPALELGRSFVRPEYQRQYAPLLMLWKGIGRYLAAHPEIAVLFGAVSISSRYKQASRDLIVRYFREREAEREDGEDLACWVSPRTPFHPGKSASAPALCWKLRNLDELSGPIMDLENDGKGVPILIKHYARLGGRLLSFNVDRHFSNVLDGFVLVDLRRSDPAVLERYLGADGVAALRRYHGCFSHGSLTPA